VYPYHDAAGEPLYYVCRFRTDDNGGKTFLQGHPNGTRWVWNIKGIEPVLYRLPEVRALIERGEEHVPLYIVEGEKAVEYLRAHLTREGLPGAVTCSPMGAGKWREEYTEALRGLRYAIVGADDDEPGREHARHVAAELARQGARVELRLPALNLDKAGIDDHLEAGHTLRQLVPLQAEPASVEQAPPEPFEGLSHADVLRLTFEAEPHLVADLIEVGTPGAIAGVPETYKSWTAQAVAVRVAQGEGEVLGRAVASPGGPVGYFWQDDSRRNEAERAQAYSAAHELPGELRLRWHLNEGLELPRDLARLRATVERHGYVLVVLDSFYNFVTGIELKGEDAAVIVAALKREVCDPTECTVLIVDHAPWPNEGNAGQRRAYGSVLKSAAIRWAIFLERKRSTLYVQASGNNVRGIPRTPAVWDEEALELRLVKKGEVEEAYEEARAWLLEYIEREAERSRAPSRGQAEKAYAEAHEGKGRSRARRVLDAELGAFDAWVEIGEDEREARRANGEPEPALARGTGEALNGVYLKPFRHASSPLATEQTASPASSLLGATEGEPLAGLANHPKGGEPNGERARGGDKEPAEEELQGELQAEGPPDPDKDIPW
jgi:hypothetical protein